MSRNGQTDPFVFDDNSDSTKAYARLNNKCRQFIDSLTRFKILTEGLDKYCEEVTQDLLDAIRNFMKDTREILVKCAPDSDESIANLYPTLKQNLYRFQVCLFVFSGRISLRQYEDFFASLQSEIPELEGVSKVDLFQEISLTFESAHKNLMETVKGITSSFSKKHDTVRLELMGLTAISILFSSVAATTLATSSSQESTGFNKAANALWFSSLLLGICSAMISLLGMEWHSITGWKPRPNDPGRRVYFKKAFHYEYRKLTESWMYNYMRSIPIICLSVGTAAFTVGLCLYAFSFEHGSAIPIYVSALAVVLFLFLVSFLASINSYNAVTINMSNSS